MLTISQVYARINLAIVDSKIITAQTTDAEIRMMTEVVRAMFTSAREEQLLLLKQEAERVEQRKRGEVSTQLHT